MSLLLLNVRLETAPLRAWDGVSVSVSTTSYDMNVNEAKTRYLYALNTQRSLLDALIEKNERDYLPICS